MATFTRVLSFSRVMGVAFVGSVLAVGCVISSDDDSGIFDDDDAGLTGDGDITGDGDPIIGDGDPDVDGGVIGDGDPEVDGGNEPQCFAPDETESCGACVADNCLAEWCACDADPTCGLPPGDEPGDEFYCMNTCLLEFSDMGETADDAFTTCAEGCAVSEDFILADTTLDLISCLRAPVADPSLADAGVDAGGFEIAVCGDTCFGYDEPATE